VSSLRVRLVLATSVVVVLAVVAVGLASSRITREQFRLLERDPGGGPPRGERVEERVFVTGVNRWLLGAVVGSGILAILATALFARRILSPVEALTAAARRMERGDLAARVPEASRDELGALARAFNSMAESLERTEELRRKLVADVAHELRTPLTNIRCELEAIADGLTKPDAPALKSLLEEALLLQRLVDDLQDLALAEAGQLRLHAEAVVLGDEVQRALGLHAARAAATGVTLSTAIPPALPGARADRVRLAQVLRNLLENAVTHTPRGGHVIVSARVEGTDVAVTVRDDGTGIAPEHLPHVFDRFYRADPSRARTTGGAGLGLAIVKQLVEAQGGRVRAESMPGAGSTFTFTLPAFIESS